MAKSTAAKSAFSQLIHVGLVVRDMDKAIERLSSLGIGPFKSTSLPSFTEFALFRGEPMEAKVAESRAKIGDVELELLQPVEGKSPQQEFLDSKGEGIQHLAFAVDDLDKEVDRLTKQGVSVMLNGKWEGGGFAYLDLGDGGLIVELFQG